MKAQRSSSQESEGIEERKHFSIPKIRISVPLVLVPGMMGSQLWDGEFTGRRIWPFWHWGMKGKLTFESLNLLVSTPSKIAHDIFPDVYAGLLYALKSMGYILNKNLWIFSYDWTESNEISGQRLTQFIYDIIKNKWKEVDVINHSMGGIVTRAACEICKAPIRRTIYLASPHFGTPRAFVSLHPDVKLNFFSGWRVNFVANVVWRQHMRVIGDERTLEEELKWIGAQFQSIYELLPDQYYLTNERPMLFVEHGMDKLINSDIKRTPIIGVEATYYDNKFTRFRSSDQLNKIRKAMRFKNKLGNDFTGRNLIIYSSSEITADSVDYYEIFNIDGEYPTSGKYSGWRKPKDLGQHGDGIIPTYSATAGYTIAKNVGGTHLGVPNNPYAHLEIANFLGKH